MARMKLAFVKRAAALGIVALAASLSLTSARAADDLKVRFTWKL